MFPCYSNEIQLISFRKCPRDQLPDDKACSSDSRITNSSKSFTYKMAAKTMQLA